MVLKTREKLLEVARQLFVRKGLENTTMNDIANASDKGRRTIYTYFKNKREIYNAVLERESEQIVSRLRAVIEDPSLSPVERLRRFLEVRYAISAQGSVTREGSLITRFTRDMRRSDRIRHMAVAKEDELLQRVLDEGVAAGEFDPQQCKRFVELQPLFLQGVELPHQRGGLKDIAGANAELAKSYVDFMTTALLKEV